MNIKNKTESKLDSVIKTETTGVNFRNRHSVANAVGNVYMETGDMNYTWTDETETIMVDNGLYKAVPMILDRIYTVNKIPITGRYSVSAIIRTMENEKEALL